MKSWSSFRTRIAVLFALLTALGMSGLSLGIGRHVAATEVRDQGEVLHALGRAMANSFSVGLAERLREIELLAAALDARRMALSPEAWQPLIRRTQETQTRYAWIGVADPEGRVRASHDHLLVGASVAERPWFQAALRGPFVGDVHGAKLLAKLLPPTQDGEPLRLLDFAAPLHDDAGRLVGVLGAHVSWAWAREVIDSVRSGQVQERGVEVLILDRRGTVIHPGPSVAASVDMAGLTPGRAVHARWSDGRDYLTVAVPVPARAAAADLGWRVVVRQPEHLAQAAAHQAERAVLMAGALAALAVAGLAWLVLGSVLRPLQAIASAAQAIERGDLHARMPQPGGGRELRQLGEAIGSMTRRLIEANETLETRVAQRTAELERANAELDRLATRDGLTGLWNRRAADQRLAAEIARHQRTGGTLALMLADIDHFKRINDTLGHAAGDAVLQAVAARLAGACRGTDTVARYGGEEFLLLLPSTDLDGARVLAQKLLQAISGQPCEDAGRVTLSIGIAVGAESLGAAAALAAADGALYAAKRAGRNRAMATGNEPAETQAGTDAADRAAGNQPAPSASTLPA